VHMLALGVYFSGYVKDLLCLPRPLSPPLQRITMSGSAALEYGFPSTHTTNAVSAAAFCLYQLYGAKDDMSPTTYTILTGAFYCYAVSISVGRIYCGMHGWFDVVFGGLLGALITWLRVTLGPIFDAWIMSGDWSGPAIATVVLALAIRFHAEPADNCPCFDDSVAFLGVLMGIEIGVWHYSSGDLTFLDNVRNRDWAENTPEDLVRAVVKVVLGIFVIFMWRAIMKPLCLPRRYFLQARYVAMRGGYRDLKRTKANTIRYYKSVPKLRQDDNVLPPASEIPAMLSNTRKRTISVGPQSEADVREYIANREQKRRESLSSAVASRGPTWKTANGHTADASRGPFNESADGHLSPSPVHAARQKPQSIPETSTTEKGVQTPSQSESGREDEVQDRNMFSALEKPRIRYDVEVITKVVVYAGIGWLAVEGDPLLFRWLGLA
jgi:hypothetical protein